MKIFQASRVIVAAMALNAWPLMAGASTYGSGSFNSSTYGSSAPLVALGPIVLPNTGSTWVALGAAAGLAALAGVTVWRRFRKAS
jgi:LPXTG-motif cell wall-anchored protein